MSSYEDYGRVPRLYDRTRRPVGRPLVRERLMRCGNPPDSLNLVDAGYGTGAYTEALSGEIPNIIALDFSTCMLDAARTKCRDRPTRFLRASIQAIPLADGAADGNLNNLVLHHLSNDNGFAGSVRPFQNSHASCGRAARWSSESARVNSCAMASGSRDSSRMPSTRAAR